MCLGRWDGKQCLITEMGGFEPLKLHPFVKNSLMVMLDGVFRYDIKKLKINTPAHTKESKLVKVSACH